LGECSRISFIDSTSVRVCKSKRTTIGRFHGFKLQMIINDKGEIFNFTITKANVDDVHLITSVRNNMKNSLMSMKDKILLRKRSVIKTANDELKNIYQIEHSIHRSFENFLVNLITELIIYSFLSKIT